MPVDAMRARRKMRREGLVSFMLVLGMPLRTKTNSWEKVGLFLEKGGAIKHNLPRNVGVCEKFKRFAKIGTKAKSRC